MNMKMILPMVAMAAMPLTGAAQNKSGLRMQNLNKTVRPADDFYEFATGGWQKNNPLPAAYSRFGSFDQLQEDNNKDRKSTRLNSSHANISYAVFCLKKKKNVHVTER